MEVYVRPAPLHAPALRRRLLRPQVHRPLRHLAPAAAAVDVAAVHDAVHLGAHVWRLRVRVAHPVVVRRRPWHRTLPRLPVVDVSRLARGALQPALDRGLLLRAEVGAVVVVPRCFGVVVRLRRPRHGPPPWPAVVDIGGVALKQVAVPRAALWQIAVERLGIGGLQRERRGPLVLRTTPRPNCARGS